MHELSVARDILTQIEQLKEDRGLSRIKGVGLTVGKLSSINVEALTEALSVTTMNTSLEGARFVIEEVSPQVQCTACGEAFEFGRMRCPRCDGLDKEIVHGQELAITSIETEE
jgi:hydrogenase nickel incorporation protein HypA/HybF